MSDAIEPAASEQGITPAFPEYEVPGVGTVVAHEGDSYHVRTADGRVIGFLAQSGAPTEANAAADIAHALAHPVAQAPHRVLKDTIIQRVKAAGKLPELAAIISSLSAEDRFEFDHSTWFHSDNPQLLGGCAALGLDPTEILAPDPLAP